ncbi:MAG: ATP-binding protein [Woeseiaceae bacterium]|nr:ATP-binding protein [Woeseiaceae bacterium]
MLTTFFAHTDGWRSRLMVGAMILLIVAPASADPWYEHYANAGQALENQDWALAVQEINEALKRKGDSGARVRSYGMNVTSYFPYLRLGIAYYHLGQLDAASQAFDTEVRLGAIEQSESAMQDLSRYRALVQDARAQAAVAEQARIGQIVEQSLEEARTLEEEGMLVEAMSALDRALAVAPNDTDATALMTELRRRLAEQEDEKERRQAVTQLVAEGQRPVQANVDAEAARARLATIEQLLISAESNLNDGLPGDALSAANRVLALDPGNEVALSYVAPAYEMISDKLLGTLPAGNLPPAVRFVDLRQEDDGRLAETITQSAFRLNGVVIDTSPVDVEFFDGNGSPVTAKLNSQPLGDFYVTEFNMETELAPGSATFRLVATDSDGLSSSSEYLVVYRRPYFLAPWFYAVVLALAVTVGAVPVWRRYRQRVQLRRRKFNPYVAGAPVLEGDMFFGRRQLVDRILQTIHNNSLLLYGERRIGKTSIQHQLKKRLQQLDDPKYAFFPVYVDLQGTPQDRFFQTIAEDVFQELAPVLEGLEPAYRNSKQYSYREFVQDVRAVLRLLQDRTPKQVRLVLLIDEVDELNAYDPRINQKLRSLFMKNFAENLVAVVSGVEIKKQWEREGSPWYNFFEEIEVQPFGPEEARELIEQPIARIFNLDHGVVDRIVSLTGGRPYLIQKLCIALVTRLHEQQRRRITLSDVDAVSTTSAPVMDQGRGGESSTMTV